MPQEVVYMSEVGCSGGTADDSDRFHGVLNDASPGTELILGPGRYTIRRGDGYAKPLTLKGTGALTQIVWEADVEGDTAMLWDTTGSSVTSRNEEGQLYGPTLENLRIISKRQKQSNALHFYRCDNVRLKNVFVEGIAGASLYADRCREFAIEGFRTRFCGDRVSRTPDINMVSVQGSADTSNYQMWVNVFSVFPQWDGIFLDNADKIHMLNVMVHMYPSAGTADFLNNFHIFAINRFGYDIYQDWLDHFDDATNGGRFCHAVNATNGSSLNIGSIEVVGGRQEKVMHSDNSVLHYENGWVVGGHEVNGYLNFADNNGRVSWDNVFFDGSWQMHGGANGGVCGGLCQPGPSFSATQLLSAPGLVEEWFGGDLKLKRLLRIMNHADIAEGGNISLGTGTGTKIGTDANQKLALWGVNPTTQPILTGSKSGQPQLLLDLIHALSLSGVIKDQTV